MCGSFEVAGAMSLNEYQHRAGLTAVYPGKDLKGGIEYTLFGMLGEAGEIANKYKKILRKEESPYAHQKDLMDELGDVLWYAAAFAKELGYTFEEVAQHNINKLSARKQAGTLSNLAPRPEGQ
jgi:NTP pyrophosphatase (non-canonical NTP hydrolase)